MELKDSFEKLKSSDIFVKWKKECKEAYLSSCFIFLGKDVKHKELCNWQFDFYYDKTGRLTSFVVGDEITIQEDRIFREDKNKPSEINIEDVKVEMDDAIDKGLSVDEMKDKITNKQIIVLQKIEGNFVWNLSFLTNSFELFNVRIDVVKGDIISKEKTSLLSFKN